MLMNKVGARRWLSTVLKSLCFCVLGTFLLFMTLPFIFHHDIKTSSDLVEDGKKVEQASSRFASSDNHQDFRFPKPGYVLKEQPKDEGIVVIADSGLDLNNPVFKPFLWTNPGEIENGIDDDGNGCVDDIHGCSFGFFENNGDIQDKVGHGTLVAGVIAGVPATSVKFPNNSGTSKMHLVIAKCMPLMLYSLNCPQVLEYAIWLKSSTGMPVTVNFSLSWPIDPFYNWETAISRAEKAGIMVIAGVGNTEGGYMRYPSSLSLKYENVISVAAVDDDGTFAHFSGKYADIGAPGGSEIESTYLDGKMTYISGTSMATPHVTAVVSILQMDNPEMTPMMLRERLFDRSEKRVELENVIKEGRVLNPKWTLVSTESKNTSLNPVL